MKLLLSLVDKSLVVYEESEGEGRYRLLESIKQYAAERLKEAEPTQTLLCQHRDYFLERAEQAYKQLNGPEQARWLEYLESEHENLREALSFWLEEEQETEAGLRLGAALQQFWWTQGHLSEGREWLSALLARLKAWEPMRLRAGALNGVEALALL